MFCTVLHILKRNIPPLKQCAVQENIHAHCSMGGLMKVPRGWAFQIAKFSKASMKLDWDFQRDRGRRFKLKNLKEGYFIEQDNE